MLSLAVKKAKICDSSAVSLLGIGACLYPGGAKLKRVQFFSQEESSLGATDALAIPPTRGTYGQSGDSFLSSNTTSIQKLVLTQPEVFVFVKTIININTAAITRY